MKNLKKLGLVAGLATLMSFSAEAQNWSPSPVNPYTIYTDGAVQVNGLLYGGTSLILGRYDGRPQGSINANRALTHSADGDKLIINYDNDYEGGTEINGSLILSKNFNVGGTVGIGLSSPYTFPTGYKLAVEGSIVAQGVKVALRANWPDYVFKKDYKLRPLAEVEQFIAANNHLPDVPSETAVKENGIDVADMDAVLLRKVEELTLYMIQLQKDNLELKAKLEALSK